MIKLQSFLRRRRDMTHEQFRAYWLTEHVPLAKELPGLRRYRTAVPVEPGRAQYDGIAELYFDAVEDFEAVLGRDSDTEAMRDVANFERDSDRHLVTETVHVDAGDERRRTPKLVAALTRASNLDFETFADRLSALDPPVPRDSGLRRYTTATPVDPRAATADAIVELYFENLDALTDSLGGEGSPASAAYPVDDELVEHAASHVVEETVQLDEID